MGRRRLITRCFIAILLLPIVIGCRPSPPAQFRFNEVEWIKQERLELGEGEHLPNDYRRQISDLVTSLFGTPDQPKFPYLLGENDPSRQQIPLEQLKFAAGPVSYNNDNAGGLYRQHCAHCHGITGDGAGPHARSLNPYPRDFRLGKFKFKSTPLRRAPTDEDLRRILKHDIPGSAMPNFQDLGTDDIEALIAYVKYLSIRGQYERELIAQVALLDGAPLIDGTPAITAEFDWQSQSGNAEWRAQVSEAVHEPLFEDGLIPRWIDSEQHVSDVPEVPTAFERSRQTRQAWVARGKALFAGKANCVQCHGETGMGDGQVDSYDDWTNDWIKSVRNPNDASQLNPFLEAGALPPRKIRPRNLRAPSFRGGVRPQDLYLRIANGIEGTPMPSSSILTETEIWELVAFVEATANEGTPNWADPETGVAASIHSNPRAKRANIK